MQMPETGINFQKEEGDMFKKIIKNLLLIYNRTSYQEIAIFPSLRKLQSQKWHPARSPKGNGGRGSQEPSPGAFASWKGKGSCGPTERWHGWGWCMIHSWVPLWWGPNAAEGRHPSPSSWLVFFPLKSSCQLGLCVCNRTAGIWTFSKVSCLHPGL